MRHASIASVVALLLAALLGGCATYDDGYYYRDYGYYHNRDRDDPYWRGHGEYRGDGYYYYPRYGRWYQDHDHGS